MDAGKPVPAGGRVASLDALRGFDMFWIIGGDAVCRALPVVQDAPWTRFLARQVEHNAWAGFTFYDRSSPLFSSSSALSSCSSLLKRSKPERRGPRLPPRRQADVHLILLGLMAGGSGLRFRQPALDGRPPTYRDLLFLVAILASNTGSGRRSPSSPSFLYWAALPSPVPGYGPAR
jgi:hypothetical protein